NRLHTKHADILRMAYSDLVTGLPTREAFNQLVQEEISGLKSTEKNYLLVFLDLDDFKAINDTMGHEVGDTVLAIVAKQVADAISNYTDLEVITCPLDDMGNPLKTLDGRAVISRIGGDEYVAFVPWDDGENGVNDFLQSINIAISSPFIVAEKELSIKSSIGASLLGRDGGNIRELTKKADIAMYWAKQSGKNCYRMYDSSVGDQTPAELQRDVANAIRNNEMTLYYQPKIDIAAGVANSVEAVVRWMHPEKGLISPGLFIPAIDDSETADLLGEWVIRSACNQIKKWNRAGRNISISVNIANHHLVSQNFLPNLLRIVDEVGIDPAYLEIEMTEETAMTAHKRAKSVIRALKENGFTVSLDDYGKGYSNLARLAALDIDVIKLDMSLISGITEDPRRAIIVASALDMARNLNCKTVAEGIETQEQATFISRLGCDYLQGYLFAKPMPIAEIDLWFLKRFSVNRPGIARQHKDNVVQLTG
ncbi:MAG: bifunctional diguanylate cyclase/phosphodiesterase, partial [Rhizobiaceae bacterium]|nr:bifunctional diguanylate cyclase/phosphodiesterase [Rhizobiaceae bacterium]